jgi:hypothetical protein
MRDNTPGGESVADSFRWYSGKPIASIRHPSTEDKAQILFSYMLLSN